ncbi:hypothetical protein RHGRI_018246 [Rhododendron griersonianum]|uniref:Uncharacterized protein n=1 Tax=Rhododendron griersonianum TaxID=479676 RepID=A0AAV6K0R3_9ERIC|nr:hypothetical protein RHGRI_018246 [Rhododendron griersonianum]
MNPIMPKAEEGLVTSNGAEGLPSHVSISVVELLASSSASRDHGSASASSSPSDELSASGTACSRPQPTTTTVSGSNTTTSTTSGSAARPAPNTSIVPIRRHAEIQRKEPQDCNNSVIQREGQDPNDAQDRNNAEIQREGLQDRNDTQDSNDAEIQMEGQQEHNDAKIQREGLRSRHGVLNPQRAGPQDRNNAGIQREGPQDRNNADDGLFKLGEIFMGLSFQLGMALMIVQVQSKQGDSSTNLSSLSSILFNTVGATTFFCFVFTMLGWLLREHHLEKAKFCTWIGIWSGVLVFFLMISIFTTA